METEDQVAFLQAHGCDGAQGYYFSNPVIAHEFAKLLETGIPSFVRDSSIGVPARLCQTISVFASVQDIKTPTSIARELVGRQRKSRVVLKTVLALPLSMWQRF